VTSLSESRSELDAMIADIELTLVSIIQGVALTVLIETSREAIAKLDWVMWPYVLSGLVIILVFWLFGAGLLWLIVLDQRYRCRSCLRRLRMPVLRGSWTNVLLGAPHTEYICPYGHGTMSVAELQITGRTGPDWQPHEDIWKELFSLEETKK
jgi:hypothetical protein